MCVVLHVRDALCGNKSPKEDGAYRKVGVRHTFVSSTDLITSGYAYRVADVTIGTLREMPVIHDSSSRNIVR